MPSSFDSDPEFLEEGWVKKLGRRLREEPLIPIGCLATCYALFQANKAIRVGDKTRTNQMFRRRVYAQGFTLVTIVAGSIYYQDARMQRKEIRQKVEEVKAREKRDKWLRELEIRDQEDREWRERHERMERLAQEAVDEARGVKREARELKEKVEGSAKQPTEKAEAKIEGKAMSVIDEVQRDGWGQGMWLLRLAFQDVIRKR
ncbi:MAG: hypothetical protein Q9227_007261 [Pyrenula ochraceoflavens]